MFTVPEFVPDIVLLLVRIMLAVAFFREGWLKVKDIEAFSKNDGVPVPVAWIVAIAEFAAALAMLTGVLAPLAGIGIILLMIATASMMIFRWHVTYWAQKGGWEYDLLMLTLAAVIVGFGAGAIAIPIFA